MKSLYSIGDCIWYFDPWEGHVGIGLIVDFIPDEDNAHRDKNTYYTHYFEYMIWDPNTKIECGGYDNYQFLSLTARDLAPLECYNDEETFRKSRGYSAN